VTKTREQIVFWAGGFILFLYFLSLISDILLPFVVGFLTAYFLDPAADKLEDVGFSRTASTGIITISFFLIISLILAILAPFLYDQVMTLARALPDYAKALKEMVLPQLDRMEAWISPEQVQEIRNTLENFSGKIVGLSGDILSNAWHSGLVMINLISLIFISPVVAFYLLRDWDKIVAKVDSWLPRPQAVVIREQLRLIDGTLAGYIRGQSNVCLLLGLFYATGLLLVGLNFGLLIGLVTGLLAFIPYVGLLIGMTTALAVAFFQFGDVFHIGLVLGIFIIGQVLEGNFVTPYLVGNKVGLHPVWIIFGLLAGGSLFGFTGILVAVPVTAIIGVLVRFALSRYMESPLYHGAKKSGVAKGKVKKSKPDSRPDEDIEIDGAVS